MEDANYTFVDTEHGSNHKHIEYTFEGISILQHPDTPKYFCKIIREFNRIIELGTYYGTFTLFLYRIKNYNTELISYDIDLSLCKVPKEYGIDIRWGDYFLEPTISEIKSLIEDPTKRVLLLCDGGYKEYEFDKYSQYLKYNDVIMVHDYEENDIEYAQITHSIKWYDIADSSWDGIKESIKKYGLLKHELYDEFKKVMWGIFIKT
jgi:hypothetical protein